MPSPGALIKLTLDVRGGPAGLAAPSTQLQSLVLGDVNKDGRTDLVINGTYAGRDQANGPDVYLGKGAQSTASSDGLKVLKFASAGSRSVISMETGIWTSWPREMSPESAGTMACSGSRATGKDGGVWFRRAGSRAAAYRRFTPSRWPMWITMDSSRSLPLRGGPKGSITIWKRR
jgi:hypothetical protein